MNISSIDRKEITKQELETLVSNALKRRESFLPARCYECSCILREGDFIDANYPKKRFKNICRTCFGFKN